VVSSSSISCAGEESYGEQVVDLMERRCGTLRVSRGDSEPLAMMKAVVKDYEDRD
jgi:hypothetical protein